jgi:hypothetical protein
MCHDILQFPTEIIFIPTRPHSVAIALCYKEIVTAALVDLLALPTTNTIKLTLALHNAYCTQSPSQAEHIVSDTAILHVSDIFNYLVDYVAFLILHLPQTYFLTSESKFFTEQHVRFTYFQHIE